MHCNGLRNVQNLMLFVCNCALHIARIVRELECAGLEGQAGMGEMQRERGGDEENSALEVLDDNCAP